MIRLGLAVDYSMLKPLTEGVNILERNIIKIDHWKFQTSV